MIRTKPLTAKEIYNYYNNDEAYGWTLRSIAGKLEPYDYARLNAVRKVLRDLHLEKARVIDVGCGSGVFSKLAASINCQVIGVDISKKAINILKKRYKNNNRLRFLSGTAEKIPLQKDSADVVFCFEVLEHLVDPSVCLNEINRILRKGGIALVSVPNWFNLDRLATLSITRNCFLKIKGVLKDNKNISPHLQFHSPKGWSYIFRRAGFSILEMRPVYIFPPIPYFEGVLGIPKKIENLTMINLGVLKVQQYLENKIADVRAFQNAGQSMLWLLKKKIS
jgi:2-polyprenyl-3-methyl-5-hydroxy-6-metoxy-1,4-benzoquinol methylase